MANCSSCDTKLGFMQPSFGDLCYDCHYDQNIRLKENLPPSEEVLKQEEQEAKKQEELMEKISAILLTTEVSPNLNVIKRVEIVTSQSAFEINNFKDAAIGLFNPTKGRSSEMEIQIDLLRKRTLNSLKRKAYNVGANAVLGIDINLSTVKIGQISMMMLIATGTAVVIEE
jgi:uncharacterized protein YbjQ (UPF0145 family)